MMGKHFEKKYSKRPAPGIIVTEVINNQFYEKIGSYGTAIPKKTQSFRIKKDELISELELKKYVKKGDEIVKLKERSIVATFDGIVGKRGLSEDALGSESSIIISFSGYQKKIYNGEVDGVSSRINAETRSLLTRIKIENENFELVPGSLLEVTVKYNQRNSLSIPDTSILLEGNKAYVYKVSKDNIANRTEIKFRSRNNGSVEVISGLIEGDLVVAEGLKKVRPRGKIKPIKK